MARDPEALAHQEWLGYVQPVGLVVSIPALLSNGAHVNRHILPTHQRFLTALPHDAQDNVIPEIRDFPAFAQTVLGWEAGDLLPATSIEALEVTLKAFNETLRPTYAVKEFQPKEPDHPWLLLVQILSTGTDLDALQDESQQHWHAAPHAKFERLLRETKVPIGLLCNGTHLRLVYAPRGETSGYLTFTIAEMTTVAGRPIFAALHMLLCAERLFSLAEKERLPSLLAESRKYQNVVSTKLAEQVLAALFELLRGFQAANDQRKNELLRDILDKNPNLVYSGLLTVLLRLVFILYAEDRGLISNDPVYTNYYSISGLFDRLRADAGRYPDTMDQRYGAWAQLLTLFRLVHDGGKHDKFLIPARKGYLFDPDRYPFLEGRNLGEKPEVPRVSDGVIFRVLNNLLVLEGERLSYRTLDVEQIGSVYEAIMGFNLHVAEGKSIALKPIKSHGAPATINLEKLLAAKSADRAKWLKEATDQKLTGKALEDLKKATTIDELLAALEKKIASQVTPNAVPRGAMIFQPSDERRRSGSHYTPRSLTEPIVRKTLEPILKRLGEPTPQQILDLKICDLAKGSGAFLVETCRQLGDELVKAWHAHDQVPRIPPDEDEVLHARRLVAQRCIYGVDKNPMAVDLAKLSLWLVTLAKDHPFTFVDHALKCGDSLVGLSLKEIKEFRWQEEANTNALKAITALDQRIDEAMAYRKEIIESPDEMTHELLKNQKLKLSENALELPRFAGNLIIAAFFAGKTDKERNANRILYYAKLDESLRGNVSLKPTKEEAALHHGKNAITPFHWEIEFPEVFARKNGGFDAIVGNPPFLRGKGVSGIFGDSYRSWLSQYFSEMKGNADLVASFFRKSFNLLRSQGCFGLIATNTISQGDTRQSGLKWICHNGGTIVAATKRLPWPGLAAVIVSVVHVQKGSQECNPLLDGKPVSNISAYLVDSTNSDDPSTLIVNQKKCFQGSIILGMGFTFDNDENKSVANPLSLMEEILTRHPASQECVFPYIGSEEVNNDPRHKHDRFVIDFDERDIESARAYSELFDIVEEKVKPERMKLDGSYKKLWWLFGRHSRDGRAATKKLKSVLVTTCSATPHLSLAFLPNRMVYANSLDVFAFETIAAFCALQSRPHEVWARFFTSSFKDDLRYAPTDCFETFPFSHEFESNAELERVGKEYYEFRAQLMVTNNEGLTKTYNRFHDPNETSPEIAKLRELHAAMDRAVLDAYGWNDLQPTCEFLLDYEEEEEDEESTGRRKKPFRFRWPDEFRDEVLARLLELNKQRAEEEKLNGAANAAKAVKRAPRKAKAENPGFMD
jgi:hypothetical protein